MEESEGSDAVSDLPEAATKHRAAFAEFSPLGASGVVITFTLTFMIVPRFLLVPCR